MLRRQSTVQKTEMSNKRQIPRKESSVKAINKDGSILLLTIPVTTFGLGVWQTKRRRWKLEMLEMLQTKPKIPPVPLPNSLEEINELEYRKVRVRGTFDHSKEMRIGLRSLVQESHGSSKNQFSMGRSFGYHVVTPFKLADRDLTILVNRGWEPKQDKEHTQLKPESQVKGEVEIVGIVRKPERKQAFTSKNKPGSNMWAYRDIDAMAKHAGTAPVFIDADSDSTVEGGPIGGQTIVTLRNEHLQYMFFWYSLSAITFYLWYRKYWRPVPAKTVYEIYKHQKSIQK